MVGYVAGRESEPRGVCLRVPAAPSRVGKEPQQASWADQGRGHWRTDRPRAARRADADEGGGVGPEGAGAGTSLHRQRARRHRAAGGLSTALAPAEATCRGGGGVPTVRSDRRDRPDRVEHVPIPPAAPTARLDPLGSRRAPAAEELPLASAAEQGALVRIGARAARSEGSGRSRAPEWAPLMAEGRPDRAREHLLHHRFRGPPGASPVRFQVSRLPDRTARGWARGVPLAGCRFPGPAARRLGLET